MRLGVAWIMASATAVTFWSLQLFSRNPSFPRIFSSYMPIIEPLLTDNSSIWPFCSHGLAFGRPWCRDSQELLSVCTKLSLPRFTIYLKFERRPSDAKDCRVYLHQLSSGTRGSLCKVLSAATCSPRRRSLGLKHVKAPGRNQLAASVDEIVIYRGNICCSELTVG